MNLISSQIIKDQNNLQMQYILIIGSVESGPNIVIFLTLLSKFKSDGFLPS
jgi:hypothetical protein